MEEKLKILFLKLKAPLFFIFIVFALLVGVDLLSKFISSYATENKNKHYVALMENFHNNKDIYCYSPTSAFSHIDILVNKKNSWILKDGKFQNQNTYVYAENCRLN